jgi:hypothetical protein
MAKSKHMLAIDEMALKVEPMDGQTLERRTKEEWALGYMFKVVFSDSPLFRTGSTVTIQDINDQEQYHPVRFLMEFAFLTVTQYHQQKADADHGYEQAAQALGLVIDHDEGIDSVHPYMKEVTK